jgi:hypothetical protein
MKKIKLTLNVFTLSAAFFMLSCGGENNDDTNEVNVVDMTDTLTNDDFEDLFESPEIDYHLPSPLQVASIFKKSGLSYNSDATSKSDLVENYTTELNQMLNFGIYSADMAYCVLNEQSNEGRKYLQVITDLAEKIGMEAVFENKDLMERFDTNIENKDSIEILMIDIHERTEMYMDENDMQHQQAIHFAGAWTEGMYLGVYDFENNPEKEDVGMQISEQMSILGNIVKGLGDPKNDGMDIEWLVADMESIQNTFNEFKSVNNYYEDPDAEELVLTTEENSKLSELIKTLRTKITNG